MANKLANLRKDLANVEAKIDRLNHYREYLRKRLSQSETTTTDLGEGGNVLRPVSDHYVSRAQVTTIRVADGVIGAAWRLDPTLLVISRSRQNLDLAEFRRLCNSQEADEQERVWMTLFAWWRVACVEEDSDLQSRIAEALTQGGIQDDDDRIVTFNNRVSALLLE